eukprot:2660887-Rhodomonas_salina.1
MSGTVLRSACAVLCGTDIGNTRLPPCAIRMALCAIRMALCTIRMALCTIRMALCTIRMALCGVRYGDSLCCYALLSAVSA